MSGMADLRQHQSADAASQVVLTDPVNALSPFLTLPAHREYTHRGWVAVRGNDTRSLPVRCSPSSAAPRPSTGGPAAARASRATWLQYRHARLLRTCVRGPRRRSLSRVRHSELDMRL